MTQTFTAVLHKEDDFYVAECPEVGITSQGSSIGGTSGRLKQNFKFSQIFSLL
jgi:predicted RNase H-like HicB family nuclease